ncbi:serine hydrolase domain-containing protein [Actinomadura syzygii]|uniref:Beta-lactamase family protein n=1 Tax=Actinomadura syzygii TaxID=1427538 RepID=A0A5D0TTJ1_9ACTN|nr:serine hydrolase domain-containing protein [Actinomadura syzygii]TYC08676.1 beta-lactamase family protein [Actinomadura syzygii]
MRTPLIERRRFLAGTAALPILAVSAAPARATDGAATRAVDDEQGARRVLTGLIARDGLPGAQAVITRPGGRTTQVVAGAGDLRTGRPYPHDARLRIASNTKTFTATTVLQLVAEGRLALDEPISRHLPRVPGKATVRQVLRHQSGFHDFTEDVNEHARGHYRARDLARDALRRPSRFEPGERWEYCNTNYVLAGLLIEAVTGRPAEAEITRRVIRPLGLRHTFWPRYPEQGLRGPHAHAYMPPGHTEVNWINTSVVGTAGALVSTGRELNTFFRALLGGRLLPPAMLAEMRRTVPADIAEGARYGLGLAGFPLPGGGVFWGHGGTIEGTRTRGGVTGTGLAVTVAVNEIAADPRGSQHLLDAAATILRSH